MEKVMIESLADVLEEAGYEDAMGLIEAVLIPEAIKKGVSLRTAMRNHADTKGLGSHEDLRLALRNVEIARLADLEIDEILTQVPS